MKKIKILLVALLCVGNVAAQPFSLDKNIKPKELVMRDYKKGDTLMSGKICIVKIAQNKDTAYFFVKGAGIYQTVVFSMANRKPNQVLDVALCKNSWNKPDRSGRVEGKNNYIEKFRTEGSFGIRVISKQMKSEYEMVTWISDEPKRIVMPRAINFKQTPAKKPTKK